MIENARAQPLTSTVPEPDFYQANIQRGAQLLAVNRPAEAVAYFQQAITASPRSAHAFAQLARCWNEIPGERAKVIPTIEHAISLAPNTSACFALKAWFLICQDKNRAALACAAEGLALDPGCVPSLTSLANAQTKLRQWKQAETTCRHILQSNPNDVSALNLLAQAVRNQGRFKESREVVARILANSPNDSFAHANLGYAALAVGDHLRANEHFLESLRLDPQFDFARRGLLNSLLNRTRFVRFNLRLVAAIGSPEVRPHLIKLTVFGGIQILALIGGLVFGTKSPLIGLEFFAGLFLLPIIYWLFGRYVKVIADFLLMFHPIARHALTRQEKWTALLPILAIVSALCPLLALGAWIVALLLAAFSLFLVLTIQLPLWHDRFIYWRLSHSLAALTKTSS